MSHCQLHIITQDFPAYAVYIVLIASPLRMQELPAAEGMFGVTNDGPLMRSVCDELAKSPAHTALESDVKAALNFTRKVRHGFYTTCRPCLIHHYSGHAGSNCRTPRAGQTCSLRLSVLPCTVPRHQRRMSQ